MHHSHVSINTVLTDMPNRSYPGGVSEVEILFPYGPTVFASVAGSLVRSLLVSLAPLKTVVPFVSLPLLHMYDTNIIVSPFE